MSSCLLDFILLLSFFWVFPLFIVLILFYHVFYIFLRSLLLVHFSLISCFSEASEPFEKWDQKVFFLILFFFVASYLEKKLERKQFEKDRKRKVRWLRKMRKWFHPIF